MASIERRFSRKKRPWRLLPALTSAPSWKSGWTRSKRRWRRVRRRRRNSDIPGGIRMADSKQGEPGGEGVHGQEDLSRRDFLESGSLLVGGASLGLFSPALSASDKLGEERASKEDGASGLGPVPQKVLGRTGERVSVLGLGTACMGEGPEDVEECAAVFSEAIDLGINYVDTARIYLDAETA